MKLVAHSLVPPNPIPYLHLGYLAAAPMTNAMPFAALAVVMLFIAVNRGKRSLLIRYVCLAFMCFSLAGVMWGCRQGFNQNERLRVKFTNITMVREVTNALDLSVKEGICISEDLSELNTRYDVKGVDAWGRPLHLIILKVGQHTRYEIRSNGPDKTPETKDDLAWPYEPVIQKASPGS